MIGTKRKGRKKRMGLGWWNRREEERVCVCCVCKLVNGYLTNLSLLKIKDGKESLGFSW